MKKQTIWILAILMAITFIGLLCIQIFYMRNIVSIRYEQFSQGVRQALIATAVHLEQDETRHFLEDDVRQIESSSIISQYIGESVPRVGGIKYSFTTSTGIEADLTIKGDVSALSKLQSPDERGPKAHIRNMQDAYRSKYLYQQGVLDDVILNIISKASARPITERADSTVVGEYLRQELDTLGLKVPVEYALVNHYGLIFYKSPGYVPGQIDGDAMFAQALFPNDASGTRNYLKVYFPTKKDYIFKSISFMVPAFAFTLILLIIFVYTIIVAFRQKKLTEMKNDFINNMTHEFKTPIATINIAADALNSSRVNSDPEKVEHYAGIIKQENRRMLTQVESVLRIARLERGQMELNRTESDLNALLEEALEHIELIVADRQGTIEERFEAEKTTATVDRMHIINIFLNILDNANKYSPGQPEITVRTYNTSDGRYWAVDITDRGLGMNKSETKKIFEDFYRVPTGDVHNIKGHGLGLAYSKKIVELHGGVIEVESSPGKGSTFTVKIPLD